MPAFYEFFAGAGMARAGLGPGWACLFANDFDAKKGAIYRLNWKDGALKTGDVRSLTTKDLPGRADLAWASFPCQDLSLAGAGAGLRGDRSGTFWPFWSLMSALDVEGRAPNVVVLENVCGTLTSHQGEDFQAICDALVRAKYRVGALVIDAAHFLPQSRPRLFVVAVKNSVSIPRALESSAPSGLWHTRALITAHSKLDAAIEDEWVWWRLPHPEPRREGLEDLIEKNPEGVAWHSPAETQKLLSLMSEVNLTKVEEAKAAGCLKVGTVYKRTRRDARGRRAQRAEVRFDSIAGCLRTPAGGSSRQILLVVEGKSIRSRLISPRETARLMGLPDAYILPKNYNEAYHLTGDGVAVSVVRYLARNLLEPLLGERAAVTRAAA